MAVSNNITQNRYTNWTKYKAILNERTNCNIPLKCTDDIEQAIENLNILIHEAYSSATVISEKIKTSEISKPVAEKIQQKRKLRRIWQITRSPQDKKN